MKQIVLALLHAYKWMLSPLLPPACRYVPTCSEYAMEAVERYGAIRGGCMAAWRVLRCHPFVKGGHDPVVGDARRSFRGVGILRFAQDDKCVEESRRARLG
jgi:putative membrane protein insertion efficiency factor